MKPPRSVPKQYPSLVMDIDVLLENARRASARSVNALMTATYWEIGRRIVEFEQGGTKRAGYGEALIERLSADLTRRFGGGFGQRNVECMRLFFLAVPVPKIHRKLREPLIPQTVSVESASASSVPQSAFGKSNASPIRAVDLTRSFPLPWSHYVLLIRRARSPEAFSFYHAEALRGGWSVRQLQRQMGEKVGRIGVVVPHGVLLRGAAEGRIRQKLIQENLLEAVIGLPANLFFGTGIPAAILLFNKGKTHGDVLFVDASREFEDAKNQNRLTEAHLDKIVATYTAFQTVDKYAYRATAREIADNDYNLNIPRYVDTFEEEAEIDLKAVKKEIARIEGELVTVRQKMDGYLKELGL